MRTIERDVARHYTHGALEQAILNGLKAMGRAPEEIGPEDLAAVDEFHIGGREATADLAERLAPSPGTSLLDIGCGLGGAARFFARRYNCQVTGVDITPEFVEVATMLTRRVNLAERVDHRVASALDLPFEDGRFDAATLLHVGMNIPDKEALCAEVRRVLKPGGAFAIYDIMRTGDGELDYPVPWAATAATSFVAGPETYRQALEAAGFEVAAERDRRDFAVDFFRRMQARVAESGPPPLGLHILMGADAPRKVANMIASLESGRVAPVEMICRRS